MGFFSDLKDDLSQAVNELMPEAETNSEQNETSEGISNETLSLDEMLKNIDSIELPDEEFLDDDLLEDEFLDGDLPDDELLEDDLPDEEPDEDEISVATEITVAEETPIVEEIPVVEEAEAESVEAEAAEVFEEPEEPEVTQLNNEEDTISEEIEDNKDQDEWDLEGMLANALTEETVQKEENTDEYKGVENTMEMNTNRTAVDETSVLTAGMSITGDIVSEGSLDIIGKVFGNIEVLGKLNITGHINGNSKAAEIYAEGAKINGEVCSDGAVKIGASTVIVGNITATSAAIAGAVKGDIDVRGPVVLDASAIVMGNIKSKSVQINNGAVIEGMCSQCYADVSPTSFFEDYKMEMKKDKAK